MLAPVSRPRYDRPHCPCRDASPRAPAPDPVPIELRTDDVCRVKVAKLRFSTYEETEQGAPRRRWAQRRASP